MRSIVLLAIAVGICLLLGGCCGTRPAPVENPAAPGVLTCDGGRYCFAWDEAGTDGKTYPWRGCADTATDALMLGNVLRMRRPEVKALPPASVPGGAVAPAAAARGLNAILSRPRPLACGAGKCR